MLSVRRLAAIAIALSIGIGMAEEKRPNLLVIRAHRASFEATLLRDLVPQGITFENCLTLSSWNANFAAFLSGCDSYRATGGRESIRPDVPLISEAFKTAGYRTAIFGEWGLGDALPFRPEDRGFSDFLVCGGTGIGHVSDRWGNRETDPWLRDRSGWAQRKGQVAEILASESVKWLAARASDAGSFYLQLNLPHIPGNAAATVLSELKRLNLEKNTITVLVVEPRGGAGPDQTVRDDVFVRWPGHIAAESLLKGRTSAFDLFPTLASLCRVPMFRDSKVDGMDLSKWLLGDQSALPARTFFMWEGFPRTESPDRSKSKNFTVLAPEWRLDGLVLTNMKSMNRGEFEAHPEVVADLLSQHGAWWQSIRPALVDPARVIVGDDRQKIVQLNASDWWPSREANDAKGAGDYPDQASLRTLLESLADPGKSKQIPSISGLWRIHANQAGHYKVTLWKLPAEASEEERTRLGQLQAGTVHIRAGKFEVKTPLLKGATSVSLGVDLNEGPAELEAWFEGQNGEGRILGAFFATLERVGDRKLPDPEWKVQPK